MPVRNKAQLSVTLSDVDQRRVVDLYRKIQGSRAALVGADGKSYRLPSSLPEFLIKVVDHLGEGRSVTLVQNEAQLTTVEAAKMLGVSRQFLVNLLEGDAIPYHRVGTHRRIYLSDLLAYKAKRDSKRRQVLDELTRAEANDGLYDLEPPDGRAG